MLLTGSTEGVPSPKCQTKQVGRTVRVRGSLHLHLPLSNCQILRLYFGQVHSNATTPEHNTKGVGDSCGSMTRAKEGIGLNSEQSSNSPQCISLLNGSCNRDGGQPLEDAGMVTPLQHRRYHDLDSSGDSAVDFSADGQEAASDDAVRRAKTEYAEGDRAVKTFPRLKSRLIILPLLHIRTAMITMVMRTTMTMKTTILNLTTSAYPASK